MYSWDVDCMFTEDVELAIILVKCVMSSLFLYHKNVIPLDEELSVALQFRASVSPVIT